MQKSWRVHSVAIKFFRFRMSLLSRMDWRNLQQRYQNLGIKDMPIYKSYKAMLLVNSYNLYSIFYFNATTSITVMPSILVKVYLVSNSLSTWKNISNLTKNNSYVLTSIYDTWYTYFQLHASTMATALLGSAMVDTARVSL